jgi:hypothetical protein
MFIPSCSCAIELSLGLIETAPLKSCTCPFIVSAGESESTPKAILEDGRESVCLTGVSEAASGEHAAHINTRRGIARRAKDRIRALTYKVIPRQYSL